MTVLDIQLQAVIQPINLHKDRMWSTERRSRIITGFEIDKKTSLLYHQTHQTHDLSSRIVVLCLSSFFFGYALAYLPSCPQSALALSFGSDITNPYLFGALLSMLPFGAAIGSLASGFLMSEHSRKTLLLMLNFCGIIFLGALQIPLLEVMFVFRFSEGLVVGVFMAIIPEYIRDLMPQELSSQYKVYPQISVVLGVLVAYTMGVIYTVTDVPGQIFWRLQFALPILIFLTQSILLMRGFIPESPLSLISKSRKEDARKVLALFHDEKMIELAMDQKEAQFQGKEEKQEEKVAQNVTFRAKFIGMELALFQQFCGISSNVTQAGHVISFYNDIVGRYTPIIITLAQLLGTFVSIKLLKAFELKHLTLFGGLILTICNAALGVLFYEFYSNAWRYSMQLSLTVLIAYMFTFGLTLGSTVWPYISLLLPQNLIKVATFLNWVSAGICIALFEMITGYLHSPYPVYFFYSGITLVASCLNSYLMEPMRGRQLSKEIKKVNMFERQLK